MSRVYTKCLMQGTKSTTVVYVGYTVPVGKVVIIRSIILFQGGTDGTQLACLAISPGGVPAMLASQLNPRKGQSYNWDVRAVLEAGDQLAVYNDAGTIQWHIDGYVFDAA